MNFEKIKKNANEILASRVFECSYIEYKASCMQLGKTVLMVITIMIMIFNIFL